MLFANESAFVAPSAADMQLLADRCVRVATLFSLKIKIEIQNINVTAK